MFLIFPGDNRPPLVTILSCTKGHSVTKGMLTVLTLVSLLPPWPITELNGSKALKGRCSPQCASVVIWELWTCSEKMNLIELEQILPTTSNKNVQGQRNINENLDFDIRVYRVKSDQHLNSPYDNYLLCSDINIVGQKQKIAKGKMLLFSSNECSSLILL